MKIKPFGVEMWMNEYENHCQYNLAETCVESLTIAELLAICGKTEDSLKDLLPMKQTYGEIEGSIVLREQVSGLFKNTISKTMSSSPMAPSVLMLLFMQHLLNRTTKLFRSYLVISNTTLYLKVMAQRLESFF